MQRSTDAMAQAAVPRDPARADVRNMRRVMTVRRTALILLTAVLLMLWFGLLEQRALWDPDEGRYAEIAREMAVSGDWVTPRLDDLVYIEKPPLQYWITAAAFSAFGYHNWAARLWGALAGLACVMLTFCLARHLHSSRAGVYAALALASSLLYFGGTHINTLDSGVTLFLWAVVVSLAIGLENATSEDERRKWMRLAWCAAGLAFMSKGLIGIVLPACTLAVYAMVYRDYRVWRRAWSTSGAALMLAVTLPWIVAIARANEGFLQFFFIHEHFTRFATTQHLRYQPPWFFIPILAFGALPWTVPFIAGTVQALRSSDSPGSGPRRLLAVWCVVVFLFFSASGSKLGLYILPIFPALAVLGGVYLCERPAAALRISLCTSALIAAAALPIAAYVGARDIDPAQIRAWAFLAGALWFVGVLVAASALRRGATTVAVVGLASAAMLAHQTVLHALDVAAPHRSAEGIARAVSPHLQDTTRIYSVALYLPSLSFYTGRPVTLVGFRDELDWGLTREPQKGVPSVEGFVQRWRQESDALAIMRKTTYSELSEQGVPMRVIAEDARRVVVRRP